MQAALESACRGHCDGRLAAAGPLESEAEPADSPASSASNRGGAYLFRPTAVSPGARRIPDGSAPSPPAACPRIARRVLVKGFVAKCNPQRYDESPGRGCGSPAIPET